MKRALLIVAMAGAGLACAKDHPCRDNTVLVNVEFADSRDRVDGVALKYRLDDGPAVDLKPIERPPGVDQDGLELVVQDYASHKTLTLQYAPSKAGNVVGHWQEEVVQLKPGCTTIDLIVAIGGGDAGLGDAPTVDALLATDAPADGMVDARADAFNARAEAAVFEARVDGVLSRDVALDVLVALPEDGGGGSDGSGDAGLQDAPDGQPDVPFGGSGGGVGTGGSSGSGGTTSLTGGTTSLTGGTTSLTGGTASLTGGTTSLTGGTTSLTGGTASLTGGTTSSTGGATSLTGGTTSLTGGTSGTGGIATGGVPTGGTGGSTVADAAVDMPITPSDGPPDGLPIQAVDAESLDTCVAGAGTACGSCGGTVTCTGTCSGTPSNFGAPCGSCGGTTNCAGACSVATPSNFGSSCGSCGGTIKCDGSCSVATPGNLGSSCGSCGETIKCDGSCSVATPPSYVLSVGTGNWCYGNTIDGIYYATSTALTVVCNSTHTVSTTTFCGCPPSGHCAVFIGWQKTGGTGSVNFGSPGSGSTTVQIAGGDATIKPVFQ